MTHERYDVVVIGAGLGGLTAAAYLAKYRGKRVLVLEHHTIPGGYAHEFRRGAFRFEVSLHALDGIAPGGWTYPLLRDLGVLDRVPFHRLDPIYTALFPEHEVVAHADHITYEASLIRDFPHEAQGIRQLVDEMKMMFYELRRFVEDGKLNRLPTMEDFPATYPSMLAAMGQSWHSFMSEYISDPQLQGIISALWPYYGLPNDRLCAATFILPWVSYHVYGAYYPEGGSMAMSRAIEQTILEHGGDIRYKQTVERIEMRDGMAVAVETNTGVRVEADTFVSNANAPDTMLKMIGKEHLPTDYVQKIEQENPAISSLVVYLGLNRDLTAEGWRHHDLFLPTTYDTNEAYTTMEQGRFEDTSLAITYYNQSDPTCSPEGCSSIAVMTLAPWEYADQWGTGGDIHNYEKNPRYRQIKEEAAAHLLARAEQYIPNLRASIQHQEIATPLTNWRFSRNPGGSFYGTEQTVENMYSSRLNAVSPIPNLFLAGAWVMGGGMSPAMLSGRNAADLVCQYLAGEEVKPLIMPAPALPATAADLFSAAGSIAEEADQEQAEVATERNAYGEEHMPTPPPQKTSVEVDAGQRKLPRATLTAIGSGRKVAIDSLGKPAVLVFHTRETIGVSEDMNHVVDDHYVLAEEVIVASVVDLHVVPSPFRFIPEAAMTKSYREVEERLPERLDASTHVLILPDWDGAVTRAVGAKHVNKTAAVVVADADGTIVGIYQGDDPTTAALGFLEKCVKR